MTVWARWEWCCRATGRDERDTRQTANFPGVTDISSRGEGVRRPAGSSLRLRRGGGGRGWSQTYLGGRAQEGLLRLDGFESEDSWVMEAVTRGSLSLFRGGPGPSCSSSFPVSLDTAALNQACEGGREGAGSSNSHLDHS